MSEPVRQAAIVRADDPARAIDLRAIHAMLQAKAGNIASRALPELRQGTMAPAASRVSDTLRPMIGWVRAHLGSSEHGVSEHGAAVPGTAGETGGLLRAYVALRVEYDTREAHRLATQIGDAARKPDLPAASW